MKRRAILLLVMGFLYLAAAGQKTTLVKKNHEKFVETYYVLASDKKVKHGLYVNLIKLDIGGVLISSKGTYANGQKEGFWEIYYPIGNNIRESGFYHKDLRDSLWTVFYPGMELRELEEVEEGGQHVIRVVGASPVINAEGAYKEGGPAGVWKFFDGENTLIQKYDYSSHTLVFLESRSIDNRPAGFIGGEYLQNQYLHEVFDMNGLLSTINSKLDLKSGEVTFELHINEQGNMNVVEARNSIKNKKVYNRAMETAKALNGRFYTRMENGVNKPDVRTVNFAFEAKLSTMNYVFEKSISHNTNMSFNMKITVE